MVDRDRNRVADEVKDFAPSIAFDIPNGPCFSDDGFPYIAERNRQTAAGQHFGFPWTNGRFEFPDHQHVPRPEGVEVTDPQVKMQAHAADLGMGFYRHDSFPEAYRGGIFPARHGSSNGTTPVGARVMCTALDAEGNAASTPVFGDGWLNESAGEDRGRAMDIAFLPDGSMLVSGAEIRAGATWDSSVKPTF